MGDCDECARRLAAAKGDGLVGYLLCERCRPQRDSLEDAEQALSSAERLTLEALEQLRATRAALRSGTATPAEVLDLCVEADDLLDQALDATPSTLLAELVEPEEVGDDGGPVFVRPSVWAAEAARNGIDRVAKERVLPLRLQALSDATAARGLADRGYNAWTWLVEAAERHGMSFYRATGLDGVGWELRRGYEFIYFEDSPEGLAQALRKFADLVAPPEPQPQRLTGAESRRLETTGLSEELQRVIDFHPWMAVRS